MEYDYATIRERETVKPGLPPTVIVSPTLVLTRMYSSASSDDGLILGVFNFP